MKPSLRRLRPILLLLVAALPAACASPPPVAEPPAAGAQATPPARDGAVALDWLPPHDRTDGSALPDEDIAGYRIYVGEQPGRHLTVIEVPDPARTDAIIGELEPGQAYYIAIATLDRGGQESPKSREIREIARPRADVQAALKEHRSARDRSPRSDRG